MITISDLFIALSVMTVLIIIGTILLSVLAQFSSKDSLFCKRKVKGKYGYYDVQIDLLIDSEEEPQYTVFVYRYSRFFPRMGSSLHKKRFFGRGKPNFIQMAKETIKETEEEMMKIKEKEKLRKQNKEQAKLQQNNWNGKVY